MSPRVTSGAPGARRPRREPVDEKLLLRLTHEQRAGLVAAAERLGLTRSEVIRMALDALFDDLALVLIKAKR